MTFFSAPFPLERNTRQGWPISPLIFNLCLKPLACAIRQNPNSYSFVHNSHKFKVALGADDLLLLISEPKSSILKLMKAINVWRCVHYSD